jgi:hypothetical protein
MLGLVDNLIEMKNARCATKIHNKVSETFSYRNQNVSETLIKIILNWNTNMAAVTSCANAQY